MNLLRPLPLAATGLVAAPLATLLLWPADAVTGHSPPMAARTQAMDAGGRTPAERALAALAQARHVSRSPLRRADPDEFERVSREAGRMAGREALERDRAAPPRDRVRTASVLQGWAEGEATAALTWWRELPPGEFRATLLPGLLAGLAASAPGMARDVFAALPPGEQQAQLPDFLAAIRENQGASGLRDWFAALPDESADPTVTWRAFHPLVAEMKNDPAGNAAFMSTQAARSYAASDVYVEFVSPWLAADPAAALDWAVSLEVAERSAVRTDTVSAVLAGWTAQDSGGVGEWLNAHADSPHYDEVAAGYAARLALSDPAASRRWAEAIRDPAMRDTVATRVQQTPVLSP